MLINAAPRRAGTADGEVVPDVSPRRASTADGGVVPHAAPRRASTAEEKAPAHIAGTGTAPRAVTLITADSTDESSVTTAYQQQNTAPGEGHHWAEGPHSTVVHHSWG